MLVPDENGRQRRRTRPPGPTPEILGLLRQVRSALYSEPATRGGPIGASDDLVCSIRGTVSVTIGSVVVRLNKAGFCESDRLYKIRDELAAGRSIEPDELTWLNAKLGSASDQSYA
jgi:hypothetical protein